MNLKQFLLKFISRDKEKVVELGLVGKIVGLLAMLLLILVPPLGASDYVVYVIILTMLTVMLTASYDLLLGYTGYLSFCQGAFYGLGAYASALLTVDLGLSFWAAIPLSLIFVFIIAVIVGYPALKLREAYFAVTTFFFAHFVYLIFLNSTKITGGALGYLGVKPPQLFGINFASIEVYYYFIFVIMLAVVFFLYRLIKSDLGRIFISIREDQDLAESLGINVDFYKVLSFSISATLAGLAGGLFAHYFGMLHPSTFTWMKSEMIVIMTLVGGAGTLFGPIIGAAIVTFILELMRFAPELRYLIWAIALILILVVNPNGIMGIIKQFTRGESQQ